MKKGCLSILLLAAVFLLVSCGGRQDPPDGPGGVTLTVMGRESDMQESYMTRIFDLYEAATGNELDIIAFEDATFEVDAAEMQTWAAST